MQIAQDKYCKYANLPHTGGIPENWDPRLETLSGTGDSRLRIHLIGGFLVGGTGDQRPRTIFS